MAIVPSAHALAKPWRKSVRSGTGGCVEIALVAPVHPQFIPATLPHEMVASDELPHRKG